MDEMISRKAVIDAVHTATYGFICGAEDGDEMTDADKLVLSINKAVCGAIKALPSAQPERLTDDDFETIRIHLNAYKENLGNQHRWKEAEEYQRIIDRFKAFASAQPEHLVKESGNLVKGLVNDCISRRAAIDAVNGMPDCPNGYSDTYDKDAIIGILEDVPSVEGLKSEALETAYLEGYTAGQNAQPKYVALHESCTDCPLYDRKNYNCPRFNRVIPMAIRDAQTQVKALSPPPVQPQRWIPVKEMSPDKDGDYLVTYDAGFAEDYEYGVPIGIAPFEVDCEGFGMWYERFDPHTLGSLGSDWFEFKVVAWMPLPPSYKGEQDET